jgi:hypothetical protein
VRAIGDVCIICSVFLSRALAPFRAWHVPSITPHGSFNRQGSSLAQALGIVSLSSCDLVALFKAMN